MTDYIRPLVQVDIARPDHALPLAGGWGWFTHVEILSRAAAPRVVPAEVIEAGQLAPLTCARAPIAGLSMGGGHALQFGVNNLDKFDWIAGFSSSIEKQKVNETFEAKTKELQANKHWLWLGCGKDDFLIQDTKNLDKWLTENKIEHQTLMGEGAHNWYCWRGYLEKIMAELFAK